MESCFSVTFLDLGLMKGAKIQTSASLLLLLQRLTRDAVRFALNGQSAAFQGDIKSVDENLQAEI